MLQSRKDNDELEEGKNRQVKMRVTEKTKQFLRIERKNYQEK